MSEDTKMGLSEDEKMKLNRYVILTASIGCVVTGLYSIYHMRSLDIKRRLILVALAGFPIGYGLSQIVNDQLRQNQNENKDKL